MNADDYLVGYWLGDGGATLCQGYMHTYLMGTQSDLNTVKQRLREAGYKDRHYYTKGHTWRINPGPDFTRMLQTKGLELPAKSWTKKIPTEVNDELGMIAGLFDSDGHIQEGKSARIGYTTVSRDLADQLDQRLNNLGLFTNRYEQDKSHKGWRRVFVVEIRRRSVHDFHELVTLQPHKQLKLDKLKALLRRLPYPPGIQYTGGKYRVRVGRGPRRKHVGVYPTLEDAIAAKEKANGSHAAGEGRVVCADNPAE